MKVTRTITLTIPETVCSQVMCANGLTMTYGSDGKWHGGTEAMTTQELAEHAVLVLHTAPGHER